MWENFKYKKYICLETFKKYIIRDTFQRDTYENNIVND